MNDDDRMKDLLDQYVQIQMIGRTNRDRYALAPQNDPLNITEGRIDDATRRAVRDGSWNWWHHLVWHKRPW